MEIEKRKKKSGRNKVGVGFLLVFQIAQHLRDEALLRSLVDYFSCGQFVSPKLKEWGYYTCTKFEDNYRIVLFFRKYLIRGVKANDFNDWAVAADIIKNGSHLSSEGAAKINDLKAGMNTNRTEYFSSEGVVKSDPTED